MSEIELIIDGVQRQCKVGIDYSDGKDLTAISFTGEQAELIITALQEKLERENGCNYCNDASFTQSGKYIDSEGEICGINNYCMNCGRKLKGSDQHD